MKQRPALALGAMTASIFLFHPLAHGTVVTCENIDYKTVTVGNYYKDLTNQTPQIMRAGIWMTGAYVSAASLKAREGGDKIILGTPTLTEMNRLTNPVSHANVTLLNRKNGQRLHASLEYMARYGWEHYVTNEYPLGNASESPAEGHVNYARIIMNHPDPSTMQLSHRASTYLNNDSFTMDIRELDAESYTSYRIFDLIIDYTMMIGNSDTTYDGFPSGDTYSVQTRTGTCRVAPMQLTISATETLNYGTVRNDATPIVRNININITSGKQTPTGTVTFTSPSSSPGGRMTLNGGVVTLKNRTDNQEILLGTPVAITTRDMTIESELDPAGATPGEATAYLNVTMAVN